MRRLAIFLAMTIPVAAHEAPSGWQYPRECCSDQDCRPVAPEDVAVVGDGFEVRADGRIFTISRERSRVSPDGHYHECHMPGAAELLCFFYPPMGS